MSPRVDFYLLPVAEPRARLDFACKLAEKAFQQGHRVHLHVGDAAEVAAMDRHLWQFRDSAFVPHEPEPASAGCPVSIGWGPAAPASHDVLISLLDEIPPFFANFTRIAEILPSDADSRTSGRERWNAYREHGCTLEHHDMQNLRGTREQ